MLPLATQPAFFKLIPVGGDLISVTYIGHNYYINICQYHMNIWVDTMGLL